MKKATFFKWGIGFGITAAVAFFLIRFLNKKPAYDTLEEFMSDF